MAAGAPVYYDLGITLPPCNSAAPVIFTEHWQRRSRFGLQREPFSKRTEDHREPGRTSLIPAAEPSLPWQWQSSSIRE